MKRIVALLLAVLMCASVFAGCGNQTTEETKGTTAKNEAPVVTEAQTEAPEEFSYPTSGSLTFWQWANGNVTANYASFRETPAAGYVKEATGIDINWIDDHSNTDEAFQLMTTSDKLPDLIGTGWGGYNGGPAGAYEDGLAIKLNDVIDQYMPNFKAFMEANPEMAKDICDDNGDIYYIPQINADTGLYTNGSYLRTDMLEKVGMEMPTTLDGFHDLFVAVKEELGVTPYTTTWSDLLGWSFISWAYGIGNTEYVVDDNGNAVYNRTSENYKEFLQTLNAWYEEGLIDADIATIASADARAKVINGEAFASQGWLGSGIQPVAQASDEWDIQAIATPALTEGGKATDTYRDYNVTNNGVVISPDCENVELAARYLDYWFSEEGILLASFGKEGVDYTMVDGVPTFTDDVIVNIPDGWTQSQSIASVNLVSNNYNASVKHDAYYPSTIVADACKEAIEIWSNVGGTAHKWPKTSYTSDESTEMARYSTNLTTTANEWAMNFVIGAVSFDQWDTYIAEMEALGANEALAINQAALERYNAR